MDEREKRRTIQKDQNRRNAQRRKRPSDRRQQEIRRRKRMEQQRKARKRKRMITTVVVLVILAIVGIAAGSLIWQRYGPSKEKADLKNYYGLTRDDDLALTINYQVIRSGQSDEPVGKMIDGVAYVEYSVVRSHINERFYWDANESVLLYTLPGGNVSVAVGSKEYTDITEQKSEDYVILKTEGRVAYIALPFIQQYTNMEYNIYENPNRADIVSSWGEIETAIVKQDSEVRYQGGVKSPILSDVKKGDKLVILEDEAGWKKVCTEDGFVGYIQTKILKNISKETTSRDFDEPNYTNISNSGKINMAWHNVENTDANSYALETIAGTKGLTTIAPTWFSLADTEGNITSIASADYVNYAHQAKLTVWATLRDFNGGISSYDETYQTLSYTSKREKIINQVIAAALQNGIDGINLDFELISTECGEHYIQFVRELSVKCRQNGIVFSIDNYVPQPYNEHYDLKEQGIVADYIVIMGYDEHTEGSKEAGSVASYPYVRQGIEDALKDVPKEKLIEGIPFYTRLWYETPKTEEELASEEGTEDQAYKYDVISSAMGMKEAEELLSQKGITPQWDDTAKQNYAAWEDEEGTYKIWLEDAASIEEKLKISKEFELAGVAEWKIGWEDSNIWDLILQYAN